MKLLVNQWYACKHIMKFNGFVCESLTSPSLFYCVSWFVVIFFFLFGALCILVVLDLKRGSDKGVKLW